MKPMTMDEVKLMEKAGRLAGETLKHVGQFVKSGVSTNELDKIVHDYTLTNGAVPATLGYNGFPKSVCTSVNECICHGVPSEYILKDGDMLNIDVTSILNGFHGDTSGMFTVGTTKKETLDLISCAQQAMEKGIEAIMPKGTTGDIGFAINKIVTKKGYYVVKEIGGHGIGRTFHGDPFVPSFGKKGKGELIKPWTCLTVEPMVNESPAPIKEFAIPNSNVKYYETGDNALSAQFEHTILITDESFEVLTLVD